MSLFISNQFNNRNEVNRLVGETGMPEPIVDILLQRGLDTVEKINEFLEPDIKMLTSPFLLKGLKDGVDLIKETINQKGKIVVYGDYDCDGIGATAIVCLTLKFLGAYVDCFIPTRQEDGYGLSIDALEKVIDQFNPSLLITVDCGITSINEVEFMQKRGVKVLITDHHLPLEVLPDCIVINPKLNVGYPDLCGAGVALKLSEGLTDRDFALNFIDICAISTVADIVPLVGDNRIIVKLGLEKLSSKNCRKGIKKLLQIANHDFNKKINTYDIAFKIAPRLNASGRLSTAEKSLNLLIEDDDTSLTLIARELEEENKVRQNLCQETIFEGKEIIEKENISDDVIILYKENWEGGVIGIAASKICEDYCRPTILLTKKENCIKGSCRSVNGVNIFELLTYCKDSLIQFGGHSLAAGLSLYEENLEVFRKKANEYIEKFIDSNIFKKRYRYDAVLDIKTVDYKFMEVLNRLEPFGYKNPKPTFNIEMNNGRFNQIKTYPHIKSRISINTEIVGFNLIKYKELLNSDYAKNLIVTLDEEVFQNRKYIKGYLKAVDINKEHKFNSPLYLNKLEINVLRDNFKFFYSKLNGKSYKSIDEAYKFSLNNGYIYGYDVFIKSLFILAEAELIILSKGMISVINKKTKLEGNDIYSAFIED